MKKNHSPLRAARLKLGFTLEALSAAAACNTGTLSRIERGKQCPPDLAKRLCDVLGRVHLSEMEVLYPEHVVGREQHDAAIQPQANPQINNGGIAPVTKSIPDAVVTRTPAFGTTPPQRIKIEGHIYRLERKAGA